jgi:integrase
LSVQAQARNCALAKVKYRWHDLRHTFNTLVAENPAVSEQTIMALAGHVSRGMLARYIHIRTRAKQTAIAALEQGCETADLAAGSPQKSPQSLDDGETLLS